LILKLWFGHHVGWTSGFCLKSWVGWAEFSTCPATQTSLSPDTDPIKTLPKPSKSIHCMYQANWDDSEAMIRPSCWLDIWILYPKVGLAEQNFLHATSPKPACQQTWI
jgi:hypothetical protein